jgi:AraC-like DNA-binding protein
MTSRPEWCYAHFLRPALRVLESYQVAPVDVLAGAGLDDSVLRRPYQIITPTQLAQFYANILNLNLSPRLGLEIGQDIGFADKSALGYAQLAAQTPRHVMALGQKYMLMLMPLVYWDMRVSPHTVELEYHTWLPDDVRGSVSPDFVERLQSFLIDIMLGMHIRQARFGFEGLEPKCLHLCSSQSRSVGHYGSLYDGEIEYDKPHTCLFYPMLKFDQTLPNYDQYIVDALDKQCLKMLVRLQQGRDLLIDVGGLLTARLGHFPGLEQVAAKLEMSPRTLRRQLQQRGSSFQTLLKQAKHQVALDLLRNSDFSIDRIAELCGFSEARNFSSSFKRWQGCGPLEYRQESTSGMPPGFWGQ